MELLGDNLSELRRKTVTGKFSMATTLLLGIVFIRSLEQIHDLGYLHRDVKPSNFVIGNEGRRNQVFVIDFGLARKFVMPDGSIRPARDQAGFRGTARYASIHSHMSRDLGRRDDLWSILYILIEFAKGFLPWRKLKEKDEIRDVKINMNTPELCADLPKEFLQFMDHLQALDYADRPDYDYLIQLLRHRLKLIGCDEHTPYDWEAGPNAIQPSTLPSSPDPMRADSAGRPVLSTDIAPNDDPDNPVVYKLVAGGRRGQPAASNYDDDEEAGGHVRPMTDSAEDAGGNIDNSDIGLGGDDDDLSNGSDKPSNKQTKASSSGYNPVASPSTSNASNIKNNAENSDSHEQEMEDINIKGNGDLETGQSATKRPRPPTHPSSEKCKCTIL